jgi:hypothetical protein
MARKGDSMAFRRQVALAAVLVLALLLFRPAASETLAPEEGPSPLAWDQWQPETDRSDPRLDLTVSVWERDVRLDELLAHLSGIAGVGLAASGNLLPQRLILLSRGRSLAGVMTGLAHLYQGYWVYRREQAPQERTYFLLEFTSATEMMDWMCEELFCKLTGESAAERGQSLRRRLSLYKTALALSPETVLERFEKDDPWLCADLLVPSARPMVALVCGLEEERLRALLETSVVVLDAGDLSPAVREALREREAAGSEDWSTWATNARDRAALSAREGSDGSGAVEPMVRLRWNGLAVGVQIVRPEATRSVALVNMGDLPSRSARERLLELKHEQATEEVKAAWEAEEEAWERSHMDDLWSMDAAWSDAFEGRDSDRQNPYASSAVDLSALDEKSCTAVELLGAVAEECDLGIVSDALDHGSNWPRPTPPSDQVTVADVLYAIYCVNDVSWSFREAWLVIAHDEPRLANDDESVDPEEWAHVHHPVEGALLDDIMEGFAALAAVAAGSGH